MSERERWVVYPLIFFALGAAIRDKLLQRVEAKEVVCESLQIVDLQNPGLPLAELAFERGNSKDPDTASPNVGTLQLIDSKGNILCKIEDETFIKNLDTQLTQTRYLQVVDPHGHVLVSAATEETPDLKSAEEETQVGIPHQGVIFLNNERLQSGVKIAPQQTKQQPSEQLDTESQRDESDQL